MNDSDRADRVDEDVRFARELARHEERSSSTDSSKSNRITNESVSKRVAKAQPILELLSELNERRNDPNENAPSTGVWIPDVGQLGRFRIEKEIGRGGNGVVVLAFDSQLERHVALKIPRFESALSGSSRERFEREAQAAAMLSHPAIVAVFEVGHDRGVSFIVSQFVDGMNLAEWVETKPKIAPRECAKVVARLADAIEHAHRRGVLHRDLKAANIIVESLVSKDDSPTDTNSLSSRCRVTDFGLASVADKSGSLTKSGAMVGTPTCMSPEQASGGSGKSALGPATDVYGLGTILYQMLTGRTPFEGDDLLHVVAQVKNRDPVAPIINDSEIPRDLNAICMKCLEKDPASRYPSAYELQQDLQRFVDGVPVHARPVTRWTRTLRWINRHPQTAMMLGAIASLLVMLAIGSVIAAVSLQRSRGKVIEHLNREKTAKNLATQNEVRALKALYQSSMSNAKALTQSGRLGQSTESLAAVQAAADLNDKLDLDANQMSNMRTVIAASASLIDVSLEKNYVLENSSVHITHNESVNRYARTSPTMHGIEICDSNDTSVLRRLVTFEKMASQPFMRFASNDSHFAATYRTPESQWKLVVWNLTVETNQPAMEFEMAWSANGLFDFSYDSTVLAYVHPDSRIAVVDLDLRQEISSFEARGTSVLRFANGSNTLAIADHEKLTLVNLPEMKPEVIQEANNPTRVFELDWSNDDSLLAAGGYDQRVYVWNVSDLSLKSKMTGHGWQVIRVSFHPNGELIATQSRDRTSRIWDVETGRQLLQSDSIAFERFDKTGVWLGAQNGRLKFSNHPAYQAITSRSKNIRNPSVYCDGRLLGVFEHGYFECFDLRTGQKLLAESIVGTSACFVPDGSRMIAASVFGIFEFPIETKRDGDITTTTIGPPVRLLEENLNGSICTDSKGTLAGITVRFPRDNQRVTSGIFDLVNKTWNPLRPYHSMARWQDLNFAGSQMATGTWHGRDVQIWNVSTGNAEQTIACGSAQVNFSTDGSLLAVDDGTELEIYSTKTWEQEFPPWRRESPLAPTPIAISEGNNWIAVLQDRRTISILDLNDSLQELFSLGVAEDQFIESLNFTPDNRRLIASSGSTIHVWDLQTLTGLFVQTGVEIHSADNRVSADRTSTGSTEEIGEQIVSENEANTKLVVNFDPGSLAVLSLEHLVSRVIDRERGLAEIRDTPSQEISFSEAQFHYVVGLEKTDVSLLPTEFQESFASYIDQWKSMLPFFEKFDHLNGDTEEIATQIAESSEQAKNRMSTFKQSTQATWSNCLKLQADLQIQLQNGTGE